MSRYIATRAIRGANALVTEAEWMLRKALAEKGPDTPVAFPNTAYYLPLILGMTGRQVETIGQLEPVLQHARTLLHPVPSEKNWTPYLGETLDCGMATLLAAEGHTSVSRAAAMMAALLGAPVSTGFVSRCLARLGQSLHEFEAALVDRLRTADVLGTDETPVNVAEPGNHHIFTVRTDALVWYGAADNRGHAALDMFAILPGYRGILVRDDYGGYHKYDAALAGVQLCCAHLLRDLQGVIDIDPVTQAWAGQVQQALRDAATLVEAATQTGTPVDTAKLAELRWRYDQGVLVGISVNLSRRWHNGKNHPGLVLARRLQKKAAQVWLFTTDPRVPWTNNTSEQALRMVKLQQKISGCWRSLHTTQTFCRIRSYLTTARNHAVRPLDAIRAALDGAPWMPTHAT